MKSHKRIVFASLLLLICTLLGGCVYNAVPFQYDLKLKTKTDEIIANKGGDLAEIEITIDSRRYHDLSSDQNIFLSYHILDTGKNVINSDGIRTALTTIPARGIGKETVDIAAPLEAGDYILEIDLVEEGVTWFSDMGMPTLQIPMKVKETSIPDYSKITLISDTSVYSETTEEKLPIQIQLHNQSGTGIYPSGSGAVQISYHVLDASGKTCAEGERIPLPGNIQSGAEAAIIFTPQAEILKYPGSYMLEIDCVVEGVAWFKEYGLKPLQLSVLVQ